MPGKRVLSPVVFTVRARVELRQRPPRRAVEAAATGLVGLVVRRVHDEPFQVPRTSLPATAAQKRAVGHDTCASESNSFGVGTVAVHVPLCEVSTRSVPSMTLNL